MILLMKDTDGRHVAVEDAQVQKALAESGSEAVTVFGMSFAVIRQLRHEYLERGGDVVLPTVESVKRVFGR